MYESRCIFQARNTTRHEMGRKNVHDGGELKIYVACRRPFSSRHWKFFVSCTCSVKCVNGSSWAGRFSSSFHRVPVITVFWSRTLITNAIRACRINHSRDSSATLNESAKALSRAINESSGAIKFLNILNHPGALLSLSLRIYKFMLQASACLSYGDGINTLSRWELKIFSKKPPQKPPHKYFAENRFSKEFRMPPNEKRKHFFAYFPQYFTSVFAS